MNAQRLRLAVQRVFARNSSGIDDETKVFSWEAGSSSSPPVDLELGPDELPVLACFQGSDSWVVLTTERITLPGVWSLDHADVDAIKPAVMIFGEADDPRREVLVAIDREHNHHRIRTGSDALGGVWNAILFLMRRASARREPAERSQEQLIRVFLDPDGSGGDVLGVIVQCATGVAYGTQCEGLGTDERYMEGYFVPVSGLMFDAEDGRIDIETLRSVFHIGDTCLHGSNGFDPADHVAALRHAVSKIPFWYTDAGGELRRAQLELDTSRLGEAVEAWVPVITPQGRAVLVWPNCD